MDVTPSNKETKKNKTWIIILISIIIIAFIVAIILILIYVVFKRPPSASSVSTSIIPEQQFHEFVFVNNCNYTIFPASLGNSGMIAPNNGGWRMDPGTTTIVYIPKGWGGRFWARVGCDNNGMNCDTGDCGSLECNGKGGEPNVTVIEFTLDSGPNENQDFYDISNVDAYSPPNIKIEPIPGTFINNNPNSPYNCGNIGCTQIIDLNQCPEPLKYYNNGKLVACISPCQRLNTDQVCCRGPIYGSPQTCIPSNWPPPYNQYPSFVKTPCNTEYSYQYDDPTSTFQCTSISSQQLSGYKITFCELLN